MTDEILKQSVGPYMSKYIELQNGMLIRIGAIDVMLPGKLDNNTVTADDVSLTFVLNTPGPQRFCFHYPTNELRNTALNAFRNLLAE